MSDTERTSTATDLSAPARSEGDPLLAAVARAPALLAELAPGTMIGETFRVAERIGAGGMGVVYRARDLALDRDVAVKIHYAAGSVERLQREAMAMARLAHPNVVVVHEIGRIDGHLFVAMEHVAGRTLREWMASPRPWRDVVAMMREVGEGLAAAHAAGLIHRDFKPANVLIGGDGRPRVGDFGLARVVGDGDPEHASGAVARERPLDPLTVTGATLGTPAYMAPEQLDGARVDVRADQFAFAIVLHEALLGERPFAGQTTGELRRAIAAGEIRAVPSGRRAPRWLRRVIARGLAADPGARLRAPRGGQHARLRRRAGQPRLPPPGRRSLRRGHHAVRARDRDPAGRRRACAREVEIASHLRARSVSDLLGP
jgi:eukaryotic-like serine/threonine-protein kinase